MASTVKQRLTWALIATVLGASTYGVLAWSRGFPWQFALASAAAVTGLTFVALVTSQRLRTQLRILREPWF